MNMKERKKVKITLTKFRLLDEDAVSHETRKARLLVNLFCDTWGLSVLVALLPLQSGQPCGLWPQGPLTQSCFFFAGIAFLMTQRSFQPVVASS